MSVTDVLTGPTLVTVMVKPTVAEVDADAVTNGASALFEMVSCGDCGVGGGQACREVVALAATLSLALAVAVAVFVYVAPHDDALVVLITWTCLLAPGAMPS
ncbi:MAG TPA: hypothetical protein VGA62_04165 [Acidimicrobiia bacterium]